MTTGQNPARSRRQRERERRRNEIIDAADRVFAARGYSDATMDAIAVEAELSKGTLYLYFENKEALFLANASRMASVVRDAFRTILADAGRSGIDCFRAMLEAYARVVDQHPEKFRALVGFLASNTELDLEAPSTIEHRAIIDEIVRFKVTALRRGIADGSIRDDLDPLETAVQAWASMLGVNLMRVNFDELHRRFPQPINRDSLAPGFIELITSGLEPTP